MLATNDQFYRDLGALINTKIRMIDMSNISKTNSSKFKHELTGIIMTCQTLGIKIDVSINPYICEDYKFSTFTIGDYDEN